MGKSQDSIVFDWGWFGFLDWKDLSNIYQYKAENSFTLFKSSLGGPISLIHGLDLDHVYEI